MDKDKKIWQRLKDFIEEKGIKQDYISKRSGIKPTTLSLILNGKRKLDADELEAILDILELEPNFVFCMNNTK